MHTHPRIREYVMVGANLPPPRSNRVKCKQGKVHTVRILWINFHQCCGNTVDQALAAYAQSWVSGNGGSIF